MTRIPRPDSAAGPERPGAPNYRGARQPRGRRPGAPPSGSGISQYITKGAAVGFLHGARPVSKPRVPSPKFAAAAPAPAGIYATTGKTPRGAVQVLLAAWTRIWAVTVRLDLARGIARRLGPGDLAGGGYGPLGPRRGIKGALGRTEPTAQSLRQPVDSPVLFNHRSPPCCYSSRPPANLLLITGM